MPNPPTAAKTRGPSLARSSSSVDSFQTDDVLQKLEQRLGIKLGTAVAKPVATPARAPTTVVPKVGSPPQAKVNVTQGPRAAAGKGVAKAKSPGMSGSVSAKSTPIKSPELKRPKMEVEPVEPVESDACVDDVSKNLNMDFERAATSQQISATSQPAVDGNAVTPDTGADVTMDVGSTTPSPAVEDERGGLSRNITTMTTLPLGSMEDLDACESHHLDLPLAGLIKKFPISTSTEEILIDVDLWVKRRTQMCDINHVDQALATPVLEIAVIHTQLVDRARTMSGMMIEKDVMEQKLDLAVRAMKARQHKKATEMFPDKDPLETDFYKVHCATINAWKIDKMEPLVNAIKVFDTCTTEIASQLEDMLRSLMDTAMAEDMESPESDLLKELTSFIDERHGGDQALLEPACQKDHDLETNNRLKDNLEVNNYKGVEEIEAGASEPPTPHLRAQVSLMNRLDTTQLEGQQSPSADAPQTSGDVPPIRIGPSGRIETEEEYQARMAHNSYMRFSRSLRRADCPKPVLEAAGGKKHNRAVLGQLYEDYLSSGEDWMKSSLMANATRKISSRRRGKYKMVTYKDLKAQYGAGVAKTLRDAKKDLEQSKAATDTTTYWCEHPDFKGLNKEEFELIRVWDSLVFEDDCEDEFALSLTATGTLDENQTRKALQLATGNEIGQLQSTALGLHADSGDRRAAAAEEPVVQKAKKPVNVQRVVASKIALLSAKNAEILSWTSKVDESTLAKSLKDGFAAELESRKVTLANCKNELETLYAQRLDELSGKPDLAAKVDSAIRGCDAAVTSYAGTMKSIKLAIEPPAPKAKTKAKAKAAAAPLDVPE